MWLLALVGCNYISLDELDSLRDPDRDGFYGSEDCAPGDDGLSSLSLRFVDADGDGFGGSETIEVCGPQAGTSAETGDCDDDDPLVHPDAREACNGIDDDCDTRIDDENEDVQGQSPFFVDGDLDGVPRNELVLACVAAPGLLPAPAAFDCDDDDPDVAPTADERCANGIDDDCDGRTDDLGVDPVERWPDADGDGVTSAVSALRCAATEVGWSAAVSEPADCDDDAADVLPGAEELADDGIDQDCSGSDRSTCFMDADGDGRSGDATELLDVDVCPPRLDGDCDDTSAHVSPDAVERCANGVDDDCDGATDDLGEDPVARWRDADDDGVATFDSELRCAAAESTWLPSAPDIADCDDEEPSIRPGADEVPDDGVDQDCSGTDRLTCPVDADGDGHAGSAIALLDLATCPAVQGTGDCDDDDVDTVPDRVLYQDADGDGVPSELTDVRCAGIDEPGWRIAPVDGIFDCDDTNAARAPGLTDTPDDTVDQDCNGIDARVCDRDADGDGFGVPGDQIAINGDCGPPLAPEQDCDDTRADVAPGRTEWCDEVDHDCDGDLATAPIATLWTGTVPAAASLSGGLTVSAGQTLRFCGGGTWAGTITVAGGLAEGLDGEPIATVNAPAAATALTMMSGSAHRLRLTGGATGARVLGPATLGELTVQGATTTGIAVGDLTTRLAARVELVDVEFLGNARSLDAFADELVVDGLTIGPHTHGARVRGGSFTLVDALIDQAGQPGPSSLIELTAATHALTLVEVARGPSTGIRMEGDSELTDVVSRNHAGDALVVSGDIELDAVELRNSRVGLVNGAGLLIGRDLEVAACAQGGIAHNTGFQILTDAWVHDNLGTGLRVAPAALSFVEGGVFERNQAGGYGGGAWVQGVGRFTGTRFANNSSSAGGGAVMADSGSEVRLVDVDVDGNIAGRGAGLLAEGQALVTVGGGMFRNQAGGGGAVAVGGHRGSVQYATATTRFQANDVDLAYESGFESCETDPYNTYQQYCTGASSLYGSGFDAMDDFAVRVGGLTCSLGDVAYASCYCESTYDPVYYNSSTYCLCSTDRGQCGGPAPCEYEGGDGDNDGICGYYDNCSGPGQYDDDYDGLCDDNSCPNDGCDPCPGDSGNQCSNVCYAYPNDEDGDGTCDALDPCPTDWGTSDDDGDQLCDGDPCPGDYGNSCCASDSDADGTCDENDPCPYDSTNSCICASDSDADGTCDENDPCPYDSTNTCTTCTSDSDADGTCDENDPCPYDSTNTCCEATSSCDTDTDTDTDVP